jgi:hypothetical protein
VNHRRAPRLYVVQREIPEPDEMRLRAAPLSPRASKPEVVRAYAQLPDGSTRHVHHHVLHSPTGFEFGYQGSGPTELARCLLIDWFGVEDQAAQVQLRLPVDYHEFATAFIAPVPRSRRRWHITASQIQAWMRAQLGGPVVE